MNPIPFFIHRMINNKSKISCSKCVYLYRYHTELICKHPQGLDFLKENSSCPYFEEEDYSK